MVPDLKDHEVIPIDQIDQTVFLGDPPRPCSREGVPELLGLTDAGVGIRQRGVDETVDPRQNRSIGSQPVVIVLPPIGREDEPQRLRSRT